MDIKDIVSSWARVVNHTQEEKKLAVQRYSVCSDCKHNMSGICSLCGCVLKAKIFTKNYGSCPANKWNDIDAEYINKIKSVI